ncbi:MAG: ribosome-binding factor A, partial [Silanimonas lenta]
EVVRALNELARGFRQQLGRMLRIRQVPELHFHYDASVDRGERIDQLLREAARRDAVRGDSAEGADPAGRAPADPSAD